MPILLPNKDAVRSTFLSERLSAIAERVPKDSVVCDVGSDHGALPLYLLKSGCCRRAIVTDLNRLPLERAKNALSKEGLDHLADFCLTNGIEEVLSLLPDLFVIAGMGGETIIGILQRALSQLKIGSRFILQPMTKASVLRRFLYESGFFITDETVVSENGKQFLIVEVLFDGIHRKMDEFFYRFGSFLPLKKSEAVREYWAMRLSRLRAKIEGKRRADLDVSHEIKEETYLRSLLEDSNENI